MENRKTDTTITNLQTPYEAVEQYSQSGIMKTSQSVSRMVITGIMAGAIIALGGAVTNTAAHTIGNVSLIRLISGLLFPFGLGMILLLGLELFTGNILLVVPFIHKKVSFKACIKNITIVYASNAVGGILVAAGCALFGQLNYSGGQLAVFTINIAASKCSLPFANALVLGILCNILVCLGIIIPMCAKDAFGKLAGAYMPVCFFVICGFEHCIANMYYVPAGLFALSNPRYAALAAEAGIAVADLTWSGFIINNLIPVTIGNIIGGLIIGLFLCKTYKK